jgi:hypothetical protein
MPESARIDACVRAGLENDDGCVEGGMEVEREEGRRKGKRKGTGQTEITRHISRGKELTMMSVISSPKNSTFQYALMPDAVFWFNPCD